MKTLKVKETVFQPGRPKVAVPLVGKAPWEIVEECEYIKTLPCDVIEWRADYYLAELENLKDRLQDKDIYIEILKILDDINLVAEEMPIVFTLRTKSQGGMVELTEEQKEGILELVWESGFADFIDLELDDEIDDYGRERLKNQIDEIHAHEGRVIMSYHDFNEMMSLESIKSKIAEMENLEADMYKFAAMAYSREDAETFLRITAYLANKNIGPLIMMAMGEWGKSTRVAAGRYGSCMTFAAGKEQSAPGQVDAFTMKKWLDDYYGEEK